MSASLHKVRGEGSVACGFASGGGGRARVVFRVLLIGTRELQIKQGKQDLLRTVTVC
jgi:hypothetical protein